jgi:hypothetical protein
MSKVCRVCWAIALAGIGVLPCSGFVDYVVARTEVPDAYAIRQWCDDLKTAQGQFTSRSGSQLVTRGLQKCEEFRRGQINGQVWSIAMGELEHKAKQQGVERKELDRFPDVQALPTNYPCYAMMLFPDGAWKDRKELVDVRAAFSRFGDAIGDKGAAIWFVDKRGQVDVERALFYCNRFALSSSDGPYILVTRLRPDMIRDKRDAVLIKCAGISAHRLHNVLGVLEADLRNGREIRKRQLLFSEVKEWLLSEAERQNLSALGITVALLRDLVK